MQKLAEKLIDRSCGFAPGRDCHTPQQAQLLNKVNKVVRPDLLLITYLYDAIAITGASGLLEVISIPFTKGYSVIAVVRNPKPTVDQPGVKSGLRMFKTPLFN